jgi:hypothetical protein
MESLSLIWKPWKSNYHKTNMETYNDTYAETFYQQGVFPGRMIAGSKSRYREMHPNNRVFFNANIFLLDEGKIWWGDLDITEDRDLLETISNSIGKKLYVLAEFDGRFLDDSAYTNEHILSRAVEVIG